MRDPAAERRALVAGLLGSPAAIAPKYFYDALGCALFGAICELPEYYPTRTERAIFNEHRDDIARTVGQGKQFVDLGAGDCCKALALAAVSRARALHRGRYRARRDRHVARADGARFSGNRDAGRRRGFHARARPEARP